MIDHPIPNYFLSEMKHIYTGGDGAGRLAMDEITGWRAFESFDEAARHIAHDLRYPQPQRSKLESYGWTCTMFTASSKSVSTARGPWERHGVYRQAAHEVDAASLFYADVDNARDDRFHATPAGVSASLEDLGMAHLIYTTYSSTTARPKFRVVAPLDGVHGRHDLRKLFVWFQKVIFDGQGDGTIYDPSDFVFAPCHQGQVILRSGEPMQARCVLDELLPDLLAPDDIAWLDHLAQAKPAAQQTPQRKAATAALSDDWTVKPGITIHNPAICNQTWIAEYGAPGRSHNEDIGSILSRVWKRSGGTLTMGEMMRLYDEIDSLDGHYCARKYGQPVALDRTRRIMAGIPAEPSPADEQRTREARLAERMAAWRSA